MSSLGHRPSSPGSCYTEVMKSGRFRRFGGRIGLFVATLVAMAAPALAQGPPTLFPDEDQPTFRADVTLITNDVIVRDGEGQFISDLTKDDFIINEDGVRQEIASLVLIQGGRAFNLQLPAPEPVAEGIILPTARPRSDTAGRVFMLYVDDLHMEADETPRIRDLFKRISRNLVHEGDLFAIVSSGPSSIAIDFTYDRDLLDSAISRIMGNGMTPTDIIRGPQGSRGPSELFYRANVAVSTALDLIRALSGVQHRRKAIVYVSAGYDLNPFEESRFAEANTFGGGRFRLDQYEDVERRIRTNPFMEQSNYAFADLDLSNQLHRLTRAANRANATFYTIDPRGLIAGADMGELEGQLDPSQWWDYVTKTQNSLRTLAEATGGFATVNRNNFDEALRRIDAETSDYYVVGYYSNNSDPTRWRRRLEVDVTRDGLEVWSRSGYELAEPDEPGVPSNPPPPSR